MQFLRPQLFRVKHFFSFSVNGAERKHRIGEKSWEEGEELEEKPIHRRDQQISVFGLSGCDCVKHGADDHVGVLESCLARQHEVLGGQLNVLAVEYLLALVV